MADISQWGDKIETLTTLKDFTIEKGHSTASVKK